MEEEIPIEDNIENSINEEGWGDPQNSDLEGWSIPEDYENTQGGWSIPEVEEEIKELSIGDLFIILMDNRDKPFLTTVETIFENEKRVNLVDKNNKIYIFLYDDYNNIINETEEYKALEIIKVKELENVDDYRVKKEEIYFEVETKADFEKEYSETIKKDDLLSHLIREYDCYDNYKKIEELYKIVQDIYNLIEQGYLKEYKNNIPPYLLPILSNEIKDNSEIKELLESIESSKIIGEISYKELIKQNIIGLSSFIYKEGVGYQTDEYIGDVVKESSWDEERKLDDRKTRKKLIIPQDKYDKMNKLYTELVTIFPSDNILISGLIEPKIEKQYFNYDLKLFNNLTLFQKILIDDEWSKFSKFRSDKLKDLFITNNLALEGSIKPDINEFICHNFDEKIDIDKLRIILDNNLKSKSEIINYIIRSEYGNKLLNIDDFHNIFYKYNLNYSKLDEIDKKKINSIFEDNIKEYIENNKDKNKKFKSFKLRKKPLTNIKKLNLAYEYIFSIIFQDRKNELLKKFIDLYTRNADKIIEDPNFLYNKYTGRKLLCKHHLYSCEVNNSNNIFDTLKSKFGLPPKEGNIYCKICGEFICEEEYSSLSGFSDDKPIQSNEVIISQSEIQKKEEISLKLEKKSEVVNHISIISNMIGVQLEDEDKYKILLCYDYLDHNVLADIRYKMTGITDTDIHSRLNQKIDENKKKEKKEKDEKKLEKLKKKKTKIVSEFQGWIKNTNKVLFYVSMISLFIQTSVPVYRLRRDIEFKIIEMDETVNEDTVNYLIEKFKRIIIKYKGDPLFESMIEILENKDMIEINKQLTNTISYCNSTVFPLLLERKIKYYDFLRSQERNYLRQEWETFKPLKNSTYISIINDYLKEINIDDKLRKHYGKPYIENISIIRPIVELNEFNLSEKMALPGISILQNSSFKKIFRYTISCYGIHKSNILINLFFQNLLDTIGDEKEKILTILTNNGWKNDTQSFSPLSFKILREKIIPEIFALYSRNNNNIDTCFNIEKNCNSYIHNSVNNYDLHQLNTRPKRIYKYNLSVVFPNVAFKDMNKDMIDKLFDKYRINENGDIINKYDDSLYLDNYLLETSLIESDIETSQNKEIVRNYENFVQILKKMRNENILNYIPTIDIKTTYTKDDHINNIILSNTDNRFLKYFINKQKELTEEENILKNELIKRLPNSLSEPSKPPISGNILASINIQIMEEYISKLNENKNTELYDDYFQQIFSEYIKINMYNIDLLSEFIYENDYITSNQKQRFESIFSKGKRIKFNYENIKIFLSGFIKSSLNYDDILNYIRDIQQIITKLNKNPLKISGLTNKIPKEWNLSDSIKNSFMNFIEREENGNNIKNNLLIHNRIFVKPRNDNYSGFNNYKTISSNYHVYLNGLFDYISDEFENLQYLKGNKRNLFSSSYSVLYSKYLFINLLYKIMEYIRGLETNQNEIINDSMILFQSLEEKNEELIEESINVCSQFLMDLITHILFQHYDPTWLFMNKNKENLSNRLSKQKEREKQENIEKVHNPSPEERYLRKLKQETGQSNWWKESSESAEKYVNSDDYASHSESERIERLKEIFGSEIEYDDIADKINVDQFKTEKEENPEEDGYIGLGDLDEDGEEYLDDFDEEQEMEFNE